MKIYVKGKGEINLSKSNFIAQGGQGSVYAKGSTAYKIYTDPSKMMPIGKIQELSVITNDNIIRPQNIIIDNKQMPIGYTMRFVNQTYALCQLFTRAFREREGLDHDNVRDLIKKLYDTVKHIHSKNILIVDLNEMNFLVSKGFDDIFAIDTDSYQTPNYPATALMESIRDRHSKTFNENTDWFSFGIIAFQMWIGIHPFKGKHPSIKGFDARMAQNISVFNKDVSIPKVCYQFNVIPTIYQDWFKAVFDDGKRLPPPADFQSVHIITNTVRKIVGSNNFDIAEEQEYDGNILSIFFNAGKKAVLTDNKIYVNYKSQNVSKGVQLAITSQTDTILLAKIEQGIFKLYNAETQKEIPTQLGCSGFMTYNGRVYIKNSDRILEVDFTEIGDKILVSSKPVANVLENASEIYDGVVVQNLLGAYYLSMFPVHGIHRQIHIKELDEYRIIDAKFDTNVLMIVGIKNGLYDRFVFRFSENWNDYDIRKIENISHTGLNFIVLDNGICIHLTEDENIELFSSKKDSLNIKVIDDPILAGDMHLMKSGTRVFFSRDNKLFSMKMK